MLTFKNKFNIINRLKIDFVWKKKFKKKYLYLGEKKKKKMDYKSTEYDVIIVGGNQMKLLTT